MHENEQLKKNSNSNNNNIYDVNNDDDNNEIQTKKYEELIMKLKKNIMKLNEEKKSLEEVIIKQEEKVSELSLKVDKIKKQIIIKDKEIKESKEFNAKLTNTLNLYKKEIQKLKQNNDDTSNNNLNINNKSKDLMNIMNLQKEIQNIKKEIETKDNKINLLSMNNKILQGKVNKLSQTTKIGFNNELKNINNKKDLKISLINPNLNDNKTFHKDKNKVFIVAKPKQVNGRQNSTSLRLKNDFYKYNEDKLSNNNNNDDDDNKKIYTNLQQIKKAQKRNYSNINNIKRQNNDININNNKIVDIKYKEIESKYKKEINKEMKDDTLFDEDIVNNFDIKKEMVVGNNIESIEVLSNMDSQTLKSKKKKQNIINDQSSMNTSQEKDFNIIESFCLLSTQKNEGNNTKDNINNVVKDDSKTDNNQVQELHNHVKKILDEFN